MTHPDPSELVADPATRDAAVADHLRRCEACRRLADLAILPGAETGDLAELPLVDAALYPRGDDLGTGGMGRIYRSRDRVLGRDVAIKLPLPRDEIRDPLVHETLRRRFEREARLTARLEHPAIVAVHDAGRFASGEPFYTMRLVDGTPLSEELDRRPSLDERLALLPSVIAAADALAFAHSRGVVHRDVKPQNILCGPFGETVVIDWGLATEGAATGGADDAALARQTPAGAADEPALAGHTPAGAADEPALELAPYRATELPLTAYGVGTPPYLPPEQARGETVDARADVYALGATLYHLLAGEPPYAGVTAAALRAVVLDGPPRPVAAVCPGVPPPLAAIVARAMDRDPAARYPSAQELSVELRRFQTGQLVRAHRYSWRELARRFARRHRGALAVASVAAAALVAIGALAIVRVVAERDRAERARAAAEASSRDAARQLRVAQGINASQLAPVPARRLDALAIGVEAVGGALAAGEAPPATAVQGLVDALAAGPIGLPIGGHATAVTAAAITRDGTRLYTTDDAGHLFVRALPGGALIATWPISLARPNRIVLSPDGARALVCGFDDHAQVVDLDGGAARDLDRAALVRRCAFAPDGTAVTTGRELARWDAATGARLGAVALDGPATALAISPGGLVAAGTATGALALWDLGADRHATVASGHTGPVASLAADGDALYSGGNDGRILARPAAVPSVAAPPARELARVDGRVHQLDLLGPRRLVAAVAAGDLRALAPSVHLLDPTGASPPIRADGFVVGAVRSSGAFVAWDGPTVHLFDAETGRSRLALDGLAVRPAASAAGPTQLAAGDLQGRFFVWDVRAGLPAGLLLGHGAAITQLAASPDGARALTTSLDGTARVWRLDDGAPLAVLAAPAGVSLTGGAWSPDGARVLLLGDDGAAALHDVAGGPAVARLASRDPITAWAFGGAGEIATGDAGGRVTTWSRDGAPLGTIDTGAGVTALALAGDALLVTGHTGRTLRVWDRTTGARIAERVADPTSPDAITSIAPVGDAILAGPSAGAAVLLAVPSLAERAILPGAGPVALRDGRIASTTIDGRVHLTPAPAPSPPTAVLPAGRPVAAIASSTRDATLAIARRDGDVELWSPAATAPSLTLRAAAGLGEPTGVAFTPGGDALVVAYASGALRHYPITAGGALARACAVLAYLGRDAPAITAACRARAR